MSEGGGEGNGVPAEPVAVVLPDDPEAELVAFGRELRSEGLSVGPGRIVDVAPVAQKF